MISAISWWRGCALLFLLSRLVHACAGDIRPVGVSFGSTVDAARTGLIGKCDTLTSDGEKRSRQELRCAGFDYFAGKRTFTLGFADGRLETMRIRDIRDAFPRIRKALIRAYGEPAISTRWVEYVESGGISIDIAEGEILLASGAARQRQNSAVLAMKDHPVTMRLRRAEWLADLATLDDRIRHAHVHPFWYRDEPGYVQLYSEAREYVRGARRIDPLIVNAHIEKLVAYLSDGHAYVVDKAGRFGAYPFQVEWFGDSPYLTAVAPGNRDLLGARLVAMDNQDLVRVKTLIAPFIPVVNVSAFRLQSRDAFRMGGLLYAAGIAKHADTITLTLQLPDGNTIKRRFFSRSPSREQLVALTESPGVAVPLYRQRRATAQWAEQIGDALYIRYAAAVEATAGDLAALAERLATLLQRGGIDKAILDVRDNAGGDSHHNAILVEALRHASHVNQRGKLFVLTNHNTFSAAVNLAGSMEAQTAALFIGEKVGDRAAFAGESGPQALYQLPHSHIAFSLSFSEWSATYDNDRRDAVRLDVPVETSVDDLRAGRDPVLQAALDYRVTPPPAPGIDRAALADWIGRYDYSADKALKIVDDADGLRMEITESVFTRLHVEADGVAATELAGVRVRLLPGGALEWRQQDNAPRILARLADADLKPLERLMAGQFDDAIAAYRTAFNAHPTAVSLRANSLGLLASQLRARSGSPTLYRQLRAIATALHGANLRSWDEDDEADQTILQNQGERDVQ